MKLKNSLGLAVVAMILGGCSVTPVEQRAPYKTVEVNMPSKQLYKALRNPVPCAGSYSSNGEFDSDDRSFKVDYIYSPWNHAPVKTDVIYGQRIDDNRTLVRMHGLHSKVSNLYLRRAMTGSCK